MKSTILFLAPAVLLLTSCGGGAEGTPVEKTGTTTTTTPSTKEVVKKQGLTFKVGEAVTLGDYIVQVNKVEDFKSTDEFMQPEKDKKLVSIEVEYTNPTSDKQINSNPLDWSASDSEGYSYDYEVMLSKEPELDGKTLNPGGKVKGWITFMVPKTSQLTKVQFKPNMIEDANVEILLQ